MNAFVRSLLTAAVALSLASVPTFARANDPQPPNPVPPGDPAVCPLTGVEPFIDFVLERTGVGAMELDCQGAAGTASPIPTHTPGPTATPVPTQTAAPTSTSGGTASPAPSRSASPSPTPTSTGSPAVSPSVTPSPGVTASPAPTVLGATLSPAPRAASAGVPARLPGTSTVIPAGPASLLSR